MDTCPENFELSFEGLARICIPKPELYMRNNNIFEPAWAPVFYNPQMVENRDIAVGVVRYIIKKMGKEITIVDPLAATGVRGIRISLEMDKPEHAKIFMSDISEYAVSIMKFNVELNNAKDLIVVERRDANEYLYMLRRNKIKINYIDIDPFGSPTPFLFSAISTINNNGIVAITATDLAVLSGKYPNKLYRRYGIVGSVSPISRDIALRALISYVAKIAYSLDKYIEPVLSYVSKHYARTYVVIRDGASKADQQLRKCLKIVRLCPYCGYRSVDETINSNHSKDIKCPLCDTHLLLWYPLWMCKTVDRSVGEEIVRDLMSLPWIQKTSKKLLQKLYSYSEVDTITIRLTQIAKYLRTNTPPGEKIIQCLEEIGQKAVKSYTYTDGIVTNASIHDVINCCKSNTYTCL